MLDIIKGFKKVLNEHIKYRSQILRLAKLNIEKEHKGTLLGVFWVLIKPIVKIFIYWFAFEIGLKAGKAVNDYPYFLWLIAGVVPWFYMSDMLTSGVDSIRKYKYLVNKVKFPISVIPTFCSISKYASNIVLMFIVVIVFIFMGFFPDIYYLQIPFYILLTFVFFTAWSLFASMLSCISKDFSNLIKSLVHVVFWLSGIIWNPANIDIIWLKDTLMLNPVTYLVTGFRNCFINKIWFWQEPKQLAFFMILMFIMIVLSLVSYKKLRKEIPDIL